MNEQQKNSVDGAIVVLLATRTGLNRMISKASKIRKKNLININEVHQFLSGYLMIANQSSKKPFGKSQKREPSSEEVASVIDFWTEDRINVFIESSFHFYDYRLLTKNGREEVVAKISIFSLQEAEVLTWFKEFRTN